MTYVGYDWTEIGRNTDTSHGGTIKIRCIAWSEQNISNNTSVIHFQWQKAWDDANSAYTIHWEDAHDYSITTSGHSASMNFALGSLVGANPDDWHNIGSGDYWGSIAHNADGSCSLSFDANGYRYWDPFSFSGTIELPTIPRTSNVTLNKSTVTLNGRDGFVIYTNRASSSFSHNLFQNINGSWVQIASGVGDNYTWIPSTNFYANIGNSSKTYQILCQTWSGGTHIGDSQVNFTLASAGVHQCSLNTGSITLNGSNGVRIYTNRNSGSFLHYVEQKFSGSMAPISSDYNVTDYIDWTPPASYYTTIGGDSKSFIIRVHCKNNNGTYLGYTDVGFTIHSAGADSVSLNNTNMTMGTAYTVSIAKRVSSFRHTVTWRFGSASDTLGTAKAVDTSVGWTPSKDLSVQIPTAMTGQGTVTCQTYYEDTPIGSTSVAFNLSVPSYNVVLDTPTITETGKDNTGTALTEKGVGATEVVAIMSIKRLAVNATTSYNATIEIISVSFGGLAKMASSGSFDDTFSDMMNGNLTITAIDSRGRTLASTYRKAYTFQDYFKPSVTSFDGDRAPQTGDTGTLNAAGTFWNKTAGTTANVLTGAISISATGATTIVPTENKWTTAFDVSGVTYKNSYNFKIIVTDSFGFTAEKTYTLNASVPVMIKLKHTVRIYRNLVVSNIVKATKGYFTGDLKVGGTITASNITSTSGDLISSFNAVFCGKNLGSTITGDQYADIKNGTFKLVRLGDYWAINGQNYRVAAIDWFLHASITDLGHHVVVVPDGCLLSPDGTKKYMQDTNTTNGGYVGSKMYKTTLPGVLKTLQGIFGSKILKHGELLCNAVSNGAASGRLWYDSYVECMNEVMVYGSTVWSTGRDNIGIGYGQLPLFALRHEFINNGQQGSYWLRDVVSPSDFAVMSINGEASSSIASDHWVGVRPYFLIG